MNANSNHFKRIRSVRMQMLIIQTKFETFKPFERDSKHSNAYSSHWKKILTIWLQIQSKFEAFECKFETFEWDSKDSNANSNPTKGIRSIRMQSQTSRKGFEPFESKFEPLEIRSIQMQIVTIQKGFAVFECKFKSLERDLKHSNVNSNHLKRDSNHSNECKF